MIILSSYTFPYRTAASLINLFSACIDCMSFDLDALKGDSDFSEGVFVIIGRNEPELLPLGVASEYAGGIIF